MTSQDIKALQDSNLATNDANEITAAKLREVTTELIKKRWWCFLLCKFYNYKTKCNCKC